jgi:hypothetical protein
VLPLALDPNSVAIAYDDDGTIYDEAYTWETGQTLANEGYRVVAIAGDGHLSMAECQAIYDYERRIAADCFGPGVR